MQNTLLLNLSKLILTLYLMIYQESLKRKEINLRNSKSTKSFQTLKTALSGNFIKKKLQLKIKLLKNSIMLQIKNSKNGQILLTNLLMIQGNFKWFVSTVDKKWIKKQLMDGVTKTHNRHYLKTLKDGLQNYHKLDSMEMEDTSLDLQMIN